MRHSYAIFESPADLGRLMGGIRRVLYLQRLFRQAYMGKAPRHYDAYTAKVCIGSPAEV